ncbi:hypothetical protein [Clostridium sp. C105KSO13]|uniref:hypothetical protein n=1 Tax=Clostridium sp. C105KSO13 TaxID=1776045 RepID=UPI0007405D7C|nr:hypothetical protein [Clostridium sp. C105KSO13]CUX20260.1 hypothetical protein BN3456_00400 [Clostridium sp. C105KSO13]
MLIQTLSQGAKTDEEYRGKLIFGMNRDRVLCVLGVVTILVALFWMMTDNGVQGSFLSGVFTGTGAVIFFFSLKNILKTKRMLKNEKLLRAERLKESDERNRLIAEKAMYWAGMSTMGLCYVTMLVSGFFSMAVFWSVWGMVMAYCILAAALKKYFEKKL